MNVHEFRTTGEAYDESQCSDDIHMGDTLVVKSEKVVGFLLSAWPTAVTVEHGAFHAFRDPKNPCVKPCNEDSRDWTAQYEHAKKVARELGYPIAGE